VGDKNVKLNKMFDTVRVFIAAIRIQDIIRASKDDDKWLIGSRSLFRGRKKKSNTRKWVKEASDLIFIRKEILNIGFIQSYLSRDDDTISLETVMDRLNLLLFDGGIERIKKFLSDIKEDEELSGLDVFMSDISDNVNFQDYF